VDGSVRVSVWFRTDDDVAGTEHDIAQSRAQRTARVAMPRPPARGDRVRS
jgi:hypothetical protein